MKDLELMKNIPEKANKGIDMNLLTVTKLSEGPPLCQRRRKRKWISGSFFAAGEGSGCGTEWSQAMPHLQICHGLQKD